MGRWIFDELRGAAVRRQPNEAVLFQAEQAGEGEYAGNDALVREILQNAMDARAGDEPVRVRLAIYGSSEAPSSARLAYYFQRLKSPLEERRFPFNKDGSPKTPCRFLVCEDFGTRGLEGDTELFLEPLEFGLHLETELGVEGAQGFVEEEDFRFADDGAGESDALALAARELGGRAVFESLQRDQFHGGSDAVFRFGFGHLLHLEAESDVFLDVEVRE